MRVGVVLAAGKGTRLRPLTLHTPKPLLTVGGRALLDLAIERVEPHVSRLAVNAHYLYEQVVAHLATRPEIHLSIEQPEALGTAGALGQLREWVGDDGVLVANSDAWLPGGVSVLVSGWDGRRQRLLVVRDEERADFPGGWRYAGACLLPNADVRTLKAEPTGLYEVLWRHSDPELVEATGEFIDCGTPEDYARADQAAYAAG